MIRLFHKPIDHWLRMGFLLEIAVENYQCITYFGSFFYLVELTLCNGQCEGVCVKRFLVYSNAVRYVMLCACELNSLRFALTEPYCWMQIFFFFNTAMIVGDREILLLTNRGTTLFNVPFEKLEILY